MLSIETPRLTLIPLTYAQLQLYIQPGFLLETSLELNHYPRSVSAALTEAFNETILPAVAKATDELPFVTLWTMITKNTKTMVGDMCFKGAANANGELEIGYGTYPDFCGKGYMTEAVGALVQWALNQPGVKRIIAETNKNNTASHKILTNNLFTCYKQDGSMLWWSQYK